MTPLDEEKSELHAPTSSEVRNFLLYGLSLPERALRSATGVVGGTLRESAALLVPQAFRSSKTYTILIQQMLDFLAEDIGGADRAPSASSEATKDFVARKAVGNFIDLASLATLHLSPMLVLAVVGDLAYGTRAYLHELGANLKQQGVIDQHSTVDGIEDLLAAVAGAAATTAATFNTPPISVEGLRQTIDDTRTALAGIDPTKVLPQAELQRLWDEIHQIAAKEGTHPLAVSGAMTLYAFGAVARMGRGALSTAIAAGTLVNRHVFDHYGSAIREIRARGLYGTLRSVSRPYIRAVWNNFSPKRSTLTEDLFSGRLFAQAWKTLCRRLRKSLTRGGDAPCSRAREGG